MCKQNWPDEYNTERLALENVALRTALRSPSVNLDKKPWLERSVRNWVNKNVENIKDDRTWQLT